MHKRWISLTLVVLVAVGTLLIGPRPAEASHKEKRIAAYVLGGLGVYNLLRGSTAAGLLLAGGGYLLYKNAKPSRRERVREAARRTRYHRYR
ncbi:MAG: hypothetical protein HY320_16130 [Armatimonadetes bacterium]|nr:hypothetical protein [Armatimonadota bacterium]